jgi:surface polysaccharide O-acyltransferase-like enzyme
MIPEEKWLTNLYTRGNTGGASIYLMLKELFNSDKLQPGQKIFCFVAKSGRFSTPYMRLTYGYLMTANNLDQPALTQRIIYINPVCDESKKCPFGLCALWGRVCQIIRFRHRWFVKSAPKQSEIIVNFSGLINSKNQAASCGCSAAWGKFGFSTIHLPVIGSR